MSDYEHGVSVRPSQNGRGVFSIRSFETHEVVGPILGAVIDDADYESDYCMAIGASSALEPDPPFRYLNHSCRPNCSLVEYEVDRANGSTDFELWLEVEQDIAPGEELTIDYAWPAWAATPCRCGSADCRKWIVAADELGKIVPANAPD
jgi:uncharacterized protein